MTQHRIPAYPSQIEAWKRAAASFAHWPAVRDLPPRRGPVSAVSQWIRAMLNAAATGALRVKFTGRQIFRGGPGRGRVWNEKTEPLSQIQFRATDDEISTWFESAAVEGLECAEWERQSLTWAAEHEQQARKLRKVG